MLKRFKALAAIALLAGGMAVATGAPAAAAPPQAHPITAEVRAEMATDCDLYMYPTAWVLQLNDSWHCLGDWVNITVPGNVGTSCRPNLTSVTTFSKPAPNGWGNVTSSVVNDTERAVYVYDSNNCTGSPMFQMDARTYYDALPAAYNNKASSYKFGATGQGKVAPVNATNVALKRAGTCQGDAPAGKVEFNDSYECLGPQYHWSNWVATYECTSCACFNLNAPVFHDAGHPNGWNNQISSLHNNTRHMLQLYNSFQCLNPLGSIGPGAWLDRPDAQRNNAISSVWLRCIRPDCS
jgi:hypothetical protein